MAHYEINNRQYDQYTSNFAKRENKKGQICDFEFEMESIKNVDLLDILKFSIPLR